MNKINTNEQANYVAPRIKTITLGLEANLLQAVSGGYKDSSDFDDDNVMDV